MTTTKPKLIIPDAASIDESTALYLIPAEESKAGIPEVYACPHDFIPVKASFERWMILGCPQCPGTAVVAAIRIAEDAIVAAANCYLGVGDNGRGRWDTTGTTYHAFWGLADALRKAEVDDGHR